MFVRTTVVLLGRNLFRVSYIQRTVSSPLCNCRRYHPILDNIQALFTKKNEPVPQEEPRSIVPSHSLPSNPSNSSKEAKEKVISRDTVSLDVQDSEKPSESAEANSPNSLQVKEDVPPVRIPEAVPQEVAKLKLDKEEASSSESLLEQLSQEEITGSALTVGSTRAMTSQRELRTLLRDLLQHKYVYLLCCTGHVYLIKHSKSPSTLHTYISSTLPCCTMSVVSLSQIQLQEFGSCGSHFVAQVPR